MPRYLLTVEAKQDLYDIRDYLTRDAGAGVARSTLIRIRDALAFLASTPGAGHSREDLTDEVVKFWPIFSYMIVYDPAKRPIEIIRIIHVSRELSVILSQ